MRIARIIGMAANAMDILRYYIRSVMTHLSFVLFRNKILKNLLQALQFYIYNIIFAFFVVLIIVSVIIPYNYSNNKIYIEIPEYDVLDDIDDCVEYLKTAIKHSNYSFCERFPPSVTASMPVYTTIKEDFKTMAVRLKIRPGGHWIPSNCIPYQKIAVVVPYRNRPEQLDLFLQHMHPFLQTQSLEYVIVIVEQSGEGGFNRGKLLNIGYKESIKDTDSFWCFIFHDVDLLPELPKNLYSCAKQPRHMCSHINTFRYVLPYPDLFGGVVSFNRKQFELINGYSNLYFGWGAEDDDLFTRVKSKGMELHRWDHRISRCFMLSHSKSPPSGNRYNLLSSSEDRIGSDGLNSLEYELIAKSKKTLYTHYFVKVVD